MSNKMPFDDDMMTLIMGIEADDEPGQHGRTLAPPPDKDAIGVITEIRDMCENFLKAAGKRSEDDSEADPENTGDAETDSDDKE